MDIRDLWADARGPHAEDFIWGDEETARFFGLTRRTWKKYRCLQQEPVAGLKATKRGRAYFYRPADCARRLEEAAA